jgi:hypothetical protein
MVDQQRWIVTLSGERPLDELRRELSKAGLKIDQEMEVIGIVSGCGAPEVADKLRSVRGVADVSPDQPIDIGPPGSDPTW